MNTEQLSTIKPPGSGVVLFTSITSFECSLKSLQLHRFVREKALHTNILGLEKPSCGSIYIFIISETEPATVIHILTLLLKDGSLPLDAVLKAPHKTIIFMEGCIICGYVYSRDYEDIYRSTTRFFQTQYIRMESFLSHKSVHLNWCKQTDIFQGVVKDL